jgi:hypothetical protein
MLWRRLKYDWALGLLIMAIALAPSCTNAAARLKFASRAACCHGCGSKGCNKTNCGQKCRRGPDCRGCWKDCGGGV